MAARTARKVSIVKTPTKAKRLAAQVDRLVRLDAMLKDFDDVSQRASRLDLTNADGDRALWHMLMRWRERLPELDGYFHKCFRQCDVTDTGHEDMVIHCLLSQSVRFWKVFEKHRVDGEK